jgi:Family of unknown function (DUF6481)
MKAFRSPTFSERLDTATTAKNAALERFRARPAANDPAVVEQKAARRAAVAAREVRAAERLEARLAEEAAELAARELAIRGREARQLQEADEQVVLGAQRKVARDLRYAARKARKV